MIFLADAEASDSPDYSAPGDIYDGPSDALFSGYHTGKPTIEYPYHDRWGYWVTSVAAIKDLKTGKVVAVLGMDINADSWIAAPTFISLHSTRTAAAARSIFLSMNWVHVNPCAPWLPCLVWVMTKAPA